MDRIESLGSQLSKITMYDIKSAYTQAKNMILNLSEMEAKVQEATNDDPWGASSTLMGEIAQGTFNFQQFNEIMPAIYSRFMDKEAREWRQIYKALQLLEYLIKHGSERVVDDARSHLSTLKMLRNFHYIDEKGKDQGINVRNRAKEIAELLSDLDRVRQERRKAKANRNKYIGTGNDPMSFTGGSRYGGFSSDDYYSSGGGYSGSSGNYGGSGGFSDSARGKQYEEYDAGEWEDSTARASSSTHRNPSSNQRTGGAPPKPMATADSSQHPAVPAKDSVKEVDLLGGFDDPVPAPTVPASAASTTNASTLNDFDDFDDFQSAPSAPVASTQPAAPVQPPKSSAPSGANVFDLLNAASAKSPAVASPAIAPTMASGSSMGGLGNSPLMPATSMAPSTLYSNASSPSGRATPSQAVRPATVTKSSANFDDLWSSTFTSATGRPAAATGGTLGGMGASTGGKSIMDLQREKTQAAIWGSSGTQNKGGVGASNGGNANASSGSGLDDLLL